MSVSKAVEVSAEPHLFFFSFLRQARPLVCSCAIAFRCPGQAWGRPIAPACAGTGNSRSRTCYSRQAPYRRRGRLVLLGYKQQTSEVRLQKSDKRKKRKRENTVTNATLPVASNRRKWCIFKSIVRRIASQRDPFGRFALARQRLAIHNKSKDTTARASGRLFSLAPVKFLSYFIAPAT